MADSQAKSSLREQPISAWEVNATSWDEGVGKEGNKYWKRLQMPCLEKFLGGHLERPGSRALDLATGNGLCARWMASHGASVIATDGARNMIEKAEGRCSEGDAITFQKLDVTNSKDFEALVSQTDASDVNKFDVVLMNMAIMDVSTLEHLAEALPRLLKKDGVFAATVLHPVFMTSIYTRTGDSRYSPENRDFRDTIGKTIFEYLHIEPYEGVALVGQAQQQLYFHRPMHELIGAFLKTGLVLDGLEEPCFTTEDAEPGRMLATSNFTQLPPILGFRFRLP